MGSGTVPVPSRSPVTSCSRPANETPPVSSFQMLKPAMSLTPRSRAKPKPLPLPTSCSVMLFDGDQSQIGLKFYGGFTGGIV